MNKGKMNALKILLEMIGASIFGKNETSKVLKKGGGGGGFGGRKALNDISNSAKPSSLQASKKHSTSVISIGKDLNATKNFAKGGRKALTDLTNSSKPSAKQGSKKGLDKKLSAANIPTSIAEEQFLHDHQKCIKAQRKAMNMDYFLKEVGLDNNIPGQLVASPHKSMSSMYQLETPVKKKHFEVEEMPEMLMYDQVPQCEKRGTCGDSSSPSLRSPISPKLSSYMSWNDATAPCFALTGTPNQPKH
ncbi:hypothetical protein RND71_018284 [Anisodus tanguticus]|uniref:Uncharacterized protein n=1 Tax=Anisodus tanguticus TaxID=243964 RepID=A0AAE1S3Y0_9SOLA|nr:hypothetical protein RND71_018284 [Anisodus tanguticus]